jgi:CBS domain-containing protein
MNPIDTQSTGPHAGEAAAGSFRLPRLVHARVEDAMHPGVISVAPETPLREVARALSKHHIHCLIVARTDGPGERARWGLISSLELVRAALADGAEGFEARTAGELALDDAPAVSTSDPLEHAAELMAAHRADHLIVVGAGDGRPEGVISTLDIAGVIAWGEA